MYCRTERNTYLHLQDVGTEDLNSAFTLVPNTIAHLLQLDFLKDATLYIGGAPKATYLEVIVLFLLVSLWVNQAIHSLVGHSICWCWEFHWLHQWYPSQRNWNWPLEEKPLPPFLCKQVCMLCTFKLAYVDIRLLLLLQLFAVSVRQTTTAIAWLWILTCKREWKHVAISLNIQNTPSKWTANLCKEWDRGQYDIVQYIYTWSLKVFSWLMLQFKSQFCSTQKGQFSAGNHELGSHCYQGGVRCQSQNTDFTTHLQPWLQPGDHSQLVTVQEDLVTGDWSGESFERSSEDSNWSNIGFFWCLYWRSATRCGQGLGSWQLFWLYLVVNDSTADSSISHMYRKEWQ